MRVFNGCKIFSATMVAQRQVLGETVTSWLAEKRRQEDFRLVDVVVTQSSDEAYHCVTLTVFFDEPAAKKTRSRS